MSAKREDCDAPRRAALAILAAFTLAMAAALTRVALLQVRPPAAIQAILASRERSMREEAPRADLVDRLGRPLAVSRPAWRVFVDPARLPKAPAERDALVARLASALDMDANAIERRITDALERSQQRVKEGRSPLRYARLTGPIDDSSVDAVRALTPEGARLERIETRQAVSDLGLAPIIGKVGAAGVGLVGAELAADGRMRSRPGALRVVRDARGAAMWLEADAYAPPAPGATAQLTLDAALQRMALEELRRGVEECDAAGGRIVALDPNTGEILAMADITRDPPDAVDLPLSESKPTGARLQADGVNSPRYRALDASEPAEPALARVRTAEDIYEPGSTFKPFIWSAITERGLLSPTDVLDTEGGVYRTPYGRIVRDVAARDKQTWRDVLVNSSNIGMVKAATRLSPAQLRDAMLMFGFGSRTGVDLPGEAPGIVTPLARWNKYTHTSVAFGQEVGVTALQMVRAFSAFARSGDRAGTIPSLRLFRRSGDQARELLIRALSASTVREARRAMRQVAERARERLFQEGLLSAAPAHSMFGKSGTADMPHPHGAGYLKGQYVSSFIAAAPAEQPAIVILVVIDDPGPGVIAQQRHYGSWTAGPVVMRFAERALAYMGVAADIPSEASSGPYPLGSAAD